MGGATVATAWLGSVRMRTPSGATSWPTVKTSWMPSSDTSAVNDSGMEPGRQDTCTSRRIISRMPLVSRTPTGSPTCRRGTVTWMGLSMATSCRSTCTRSSVTGSSCMSRMMAMRLSADSPKETWSSWVPPSWPWMRRKMSLGLTVMFTGVLPP